MSNPKTTASPVPQPSSALPSQDGNQRTAAENGWIDVKHKLPPFTTSIGETRFSDNVLVWDEENVQIAFLDQYKGVERWVDSDGDSIGVTYWQLLPSPPKTAALHEHQAVPSPDTGGKQKC